MQVLALVLVFIGGLTHIIISKPASDFSFAESSSKPAGYALALFSALWTFDGWDAANYIARDISPGSLPCVVLPLCERCALRRLMALPAA